MAHTHPRAKTTYLTNPKCLNVIHHNISLYILFHAILSYLNLTNPHKHICCEKKRRMADTHLSIETTYIIYPICYTIMLPNMPFRKADAHPLRLNTRCKDLTLVPSIHFFRNIEDFVMIPSGTLKKWPLFSSWDPSSVRIHSIPCIYSAAINSWVGLHGFHPDWPTDWGIIPFVWPQKMLSQRKKRPGFRAGKIDENDSRLQDGLRLCRSYLFFHISLDFFQFGSSAVFGVATLDSLRQIKT